MSRCCLSSSMIELNPAKMAIVLSVLSVLICSIGSVAHVVRHQVIVDLDDPRADILRRLDIVEEPSLWQWFSSSSHLSAGMLLIGIGISVGREMRWRWFGLSAIAVFASVDEAIMVHEMMDRPTREFLGTSGFLSIAWIIPGSLIALGIGGIYLPFLKALPTKTATLFLIGSVLFLSGAILLEIPGGYFYETYGFSTWHYIASYAVEETLEMFGVIIILYALLNFLDLESRIPGESPQGLLICFSCSSNPSSER